MSKQIRAVAGGFPEAEAEKRLPGMSMSPLETLEHLCDCCCAYLTEDKSQYAWGSYRLSERNMGSALAELESQRARARQEMEATNREEQLAHSFDYLMAHDAYHVGQLAACRMACDPTWDSMSLYR